MQISNIRQLIDAVVRKDEGKTQVYAMAVVPQAAQCRPSVHKRLKDFLMTGAPRFDKTSVILRDLQDIYACFALSCDDIGELADNQGVSIPECIAADPRAPMAEYNPTTDVHNVSALTLATVFGICIHTHPNSHFSFSIHDAIRLLDWTWIFCNFVF